MIESVSAFPSVHQRHRAAPLLQEREQYLNHLLEKGLDGDRVRMTAAYLIHIVQTLELKSLRRVDLAEIVAAGECWKNYRGPERRGSCSETTSSYFVRIAKSWLSFHGVLVVPAPSKEWFDAQLSEFTQVIEAKRGLAPPTVKSYSTGTRNFLRWVSARHKDFSQITVEDVEDFIRTKRQAGWATGSLAAKCQALRSFFGYAESRDWCVPDLSRRIISPRLPPMTDIPKGPNWADVRRLIRSVKGNTPRELRARAMLLLYSVYALRSSEVARLRLEDFDWRGETFRVRRAKGGGIQQYPIQYEVGEAIIEYLRKGRPRCACRHVFVTMHLPYRPIGPAGMWGIIAKLMMRLGIRSQHRGPHSLRHACATYLLKKGFSLREIADFLGHRNIQSVRIYAKQDKQSLRKVASFSLAGIC